MRTKESEIYYYKIWTLFLVLYKEEAFVCIYVCKYIDKFDFLQVYGVE